MKQHILRASLLPLLFSFALCASAQERANDPAPAEIVIGNQPTKVRLMIASDSAAAKEPDNVVVIQPIGRILLDGALYASNDDEFKAGAAMPDIRAGVKFNYGKWEAKVDVGFAYGKTALKDVYFQYDFSPNLLLRLGNFVHHFGLQSVASSSMKPSMEDPGSNQAFAFLRLLGAMALYDKGPLFATLSLNVESKATTMYANDMGKTGWGGITRLAWRPLRRDGAVAQFGFSFAAQTACYDSDPQLNHRSVRVGADFPTRVDQVSALNATVTEARNSIRFTPELLLNYGRLALEAQYYFMQVNRHDGLASFRGWGAYGMLRALAVGSSYRYNQSTATLATPAPKSLELVMLYNYTSLSNRDAGIFGGRMNDISLTLNYYINKFMIWRFRTGYTHRFDRAALPDVDLGLFQTRLQIIF